MNWELKLLLVTIFILFLVSCDILRLSPFEVTDWSPGSSCHEDPGSIVVSLKLSHAPDRDSVERHFSLLEDGDRVKGIFRWDNRKMIFIPLAPLEENRDYTLNLAAEARDTEGLSMDKAFEKRFTTRPGSARPVLVSHYPTADDLIDDQRAEVRLSFSMPVSLNSLYNNVSFDPGMSGSWRLTDNGCTAIFTPAEPWTLNKRYELRVSSALTESNGMSIGKSFLSVFVIGMDHDIPCLVQAWRLTNSGEEPLLESGKPGVFIENSGWEKNDRLKLMFSKPVDSLSVKNCLNAEGGPALALKDAPLFNTEIIFQFETRPEYESRFAFRLKAGVKDNAGNESAVEYVYRIFANGANSKPPRLVGIRLPMAPGSQTDREPAMFEIDSVFKMLPITDGQENYPSTEGRSTWIEFYFETAVGASIDPLSLMELFRIETSNNVLTFSPRLVKSGSFSFPNPEPGWENFQRLEIAGILTNSINFGVVNFLIGSGLRDSYGNKNEKSFCISLLK